MVDDMVAYRRLQSDFAHDIGHEGPTRCRCRSLSACRDDISGYHLSPWPTEEHRLQLVWRLCATRILFRNPNCWTLWTISLLGLVFLDCIYHAVHIVPAHIFLRTTRVQERKYFDLDGLVRLSNHRIQPQLDHVRCDRLISR